ncbi:DUF3408 domain-containing protein [Bacteroides hominis]|uniref:DUF3408 domain-containing protein n=1 Tax=Bacteroides hominis TaxID=2763023 RepID=UPI003D6CA921
MAKKLDVDIDPGKFLDSFRPEMSAPAAQDSADEKGTGKERPARPQKPDVRYEETDDCEMQEAEYMEKFLQPMKGPVKSAKSAYIHPEFHERIRGIVRVIGKDSLSLSVYVNHVLEHHFKENEEVIRRLYKKNYKDIY